MPQKWRNHYRLLFLCNTLYRVWDPGYDKWKSQDRLIQNIRESYSYLASISVEVGLCIGQTCACLANSDLVCIRLELSKPLPRKGLDKACYQWINRRLPHSDYIDLESFIFSISKDNAVDTELRMRKWVRAVGYLHDRKYPFTINTIFITAHTEILSDN